MNTQLKMPTVSSNHDDVTFPTKVDLWLVLVLVVALGGSFVGTIAAIDLQRPGSWVPLLLMVGTIAFIALVSVPTVYTLRESDLLVRYGLLRRAIPYAGILRAYRSRNALSSPAWSLDRIAIDYREGGSRRFVLISPVRRDEFMKRLMEKARLQEGPRGLVPTTTRS